MSRFLNGTVAGLALSAMVGMPLAAFAQDSAPAQPTDQPAAQVQQQPAAELPALLQSLNLTDVRVKEERRGFKRIKGETPEGLEIRAFVDQSGNLRGIFADDDVEAALPQAVIDQMIPEAVRNQDILGQIATISAVFSDERGVMVAGEDAQGEDIRAGFTNDGTLMRFGRGDDAKGGKHGLHHKGKGEDRGKHRGRDDDDDDHGGRFHRDRHGDHGERGPRGAGLSPERLQETLSAAGYTNLGDVTRDGPRTLVVATNPQGEAVVVELSPAGEVVRESAR